VLEAAGGFQIPINTALAAFALPVVVINPRQGRDFARVYAAGVAFVFSRYGDAVPADWETRCQRK
jgi:hypothetical protein